ncbi:hypothetical protein GGP41_010518 [Bipolaris sorokiniana]|nr:hypothetical protein GGP41_010518 [Bipolaris sorokiniana]
MPSHRQQLSQLNQGSSRGIGSPPQQLLYKVGSQSPQQRPQQRLQSQQQNQIGASQTMTTTQQQLQAHQIQSSQLQTPQNYFATNHSNHSPYGTLNRPIPQNGHTVNVMTNQNALMSQNGIPMQNNNVQAAQAQSQSSNQTNQEMLSSNEGIASAAANLNPNNPFARSDYAWPAPAYYGFQNQNAAQHQQQQSRDSQQQQQVQTEDAQWG